MPAQPAAASFITPEEYLAAERQAEFKSEYYQGQIFARAGASRVHNLLVKNILVSIDNRLSGEECNVYPSDMRLHVAERGLYTYPDVSVVCGPEEFVPDAHLDTLLNPTVLFEVLSVSTAKNDWHNKFMLYRNIRSLQHYVLVDSRKVSVSVFTRTTSDDWNFRDYQELTTVVPLPALGLGLELPLAELYRRLDLA